MNGYFIIGIALVCLLGGFTGGYHYRTLRYEAALEKREVVDADIAAQAQAKIITNTQTVTKIITKVVHDKSNSCLTQPVDAKLLQQLK